MSSAIQFVPEAERRSAWLAERRKILTATDAAKVLGVSPFGGPIDVYMEKLGLGEDRPATAAMRRGKRRERLVLDTYAEEEATVLNFADPYHVFVHPTLRIGCTLDAEREEDHRPVEAKTSRWAGPEWGEHGSDVLPIHYATQGAIQMLVRNVDMVDFPVEFAGDEYRCYRLHRNRETEEGLVAILTAFQNQHIDARVAPAPDGSEGYQDFLKAMFPRHTENTVAATEEVEAAARALAKFRALAKTAEFSAAEEAATIKLFMGAAARVDGTGWYALWRTNKDSVKVAWEDVARNVAQSGEMAPDVFQRIIEAHTTTAIGARPFLFKVKEGEL